MLTAETKRHIDAARQVLVGVVPNPAAQIDQITNALIYKFMDDMDQSAVRAGDKPSFFVGELERYAWTRVMDTRLGNQERMNLYAEALVKFSTSQKLPELFRDIFRQAYLPFRSPDVLYLFLKEIDYFDYSHSEELGNAYEYLLSILGAQGDAGQFRTPRHVIDFIVDVVDPTPDDTVLDPACGTAGFLISAYKHILEKHTGVDKKTGKTKSTLTPIQRQKIMKNFEGYDISPEMVKLSRVNMYLHHFKNPKIYEYDTLAREERWNDKFSVILANPPFMSPKGGIKPNSRFSIQSSRSEVLFVDYFIEHLKQPNGRAGMIVPEGIIFQSGSAHRQIRENLIKDGLYAVVSLPAGVFNPYSGVKTSILFFDNAVVKKTKNILFVKVENDGYSLNARRKATNINDFPDALNILKTWRESVLKNSKFSESPIALLISREEIQKTEDLSLSVERYRARVDYKNAKWPMIELGELCEITTGRKDVNEGNPEGEFPFFTCAKEHTYIDNYSFDTEALLIAGNGDVGSVKYYKGKFDAYQRTYVLTDFRKVDAKYLFYILRGSLKESLKLQKLGNTMPYIKLGMLQSFKVPVPPLTYQKEIVEELDSYQSIINGANEIIINWKPKINIDANWPKAKIGEIAKLMTGGTPLTSREEYYGGDIKWIVSGDIHQGEIYDCEGRITELALKESNAKILPQNSVLIALNGQGKTRGTVALLRARATCNQSIVAIDPDTKKMIPEFLYYVLKSRYQQIRNLTGDNERSGLNMPLIRSIEIPMPSLAVQKEIFEQIGTEKSLIDSNKKLIETYENKMNEGLKKLLEK